MEETTKVLVSLDKDQDCRMNIFLAKIKKVRSKDQKTTKAGELVRLAMIGILHESKELK
jgi:hypothetical protein